MAHLEQLELEAHRARLACEVQALVDKYRAIFGWDVPDIDEGNADILIFAAIRRALDHMQQAPAGAVTP